MAASYAILAGTANPGLAVAIARELGPKGESTERDQPGR
jgi:hypothetical protein